MGGADSPAVLIPDATYRLQFNASFTFAQAQDLLAYLQELGISHCYASPVFQAGPQSTHGYDVCSFEAVSPVLGGPAGFAQFCTRLRALGMGLVLDMVPNHMGADQTNGWWLDVLKHGPASKYSDCFDINWRSTTPGLAGKVLLPVLEDHYGKVMGNGKLRLVFEDGDYQVAYHDRRFPLDPSTLLSRGLAGNAGSSNNEQQLQAINEDPARLHALLAQQHYLLAHWRSGAENINYRRFFDVTELV